MSKLSATELNELFEQQNELSQRFMEHVKAVLIEGLQTEFIEFLFEANDVNAPAKRLFSDEESYLIEIACEALSLACQFDEVRSAAQKEEKTVLDALVEKKLNDQKELEQTKWNAFGTKQTKVEPSAFAKGCNEII